MVSAQLRAVIVTRPTWYEQLIRQHGTHQQADFFLASRDQSLHRIKSQHDEFEASLHVISNAIPTAWRRTSIQREDLDRFLFEPDDLVLVVGQDGLVANVAKYLDQQTVVGINPSPQQYDGILVQHSPSDLAALVDQFTNQRMSTVERTKVIAELDDGQKLTALNELFIGHSSHQSARYKIRCGGEEEFQSSSGVIVATGTGSTGWARSIHLQTQSTLDLPSPTEMRLVHFTREAWPSMTTGTELTSGEIHEGDSIELVSRMEQGGVIFGDGIEADRLDFNWGRVVRVSIARSGLVVPAMERQLADSVVSPANEM